MTQGETCHFYGMFNSINLIKTFNICQMEILRQFEQQILLQQLQIQQQQQQQQFNAALESLMSPREKSNMSSRKDVSFAWRTSKLRDL